TNLSTLTDCTFCPFEKEGLAPVFEDAPRLAALIYTLTLLESMIFADRLRAVARMRGEERLAHFILQVQSRLRITNPNIGTRFRFPFTQELVGDCIGLSQVYVNRTFQSLIDRDYIRRVRNEIEIRDEDGMRKLCDFEDRYYDFDAGWLPGSVARATHADTLSEAAE
ncbi:MAG: Crp/Fnr family transcriptional regulator, partial [Pseudomonadota bacterium]